VGVATLAALAAAGAASAAEPLAPPGPGDVCPAIDEGYTLCSSDLMSGNCAQFVGAARTLALLYQIQVAESPERAPVLLSTNWWGCGSALLPDMTGLLVRLGTPDAQAALQQEPFRGLRAALPPPASPTASVPAVVPDCEDQPTPPAQEACAEQELAAARAAYQSALQACQAGVAVSLRDELDESELAWQTALPAQCDAAALEYEDTRLQGFARSQCLARATRERTRAMLAAHPECARPR
jgi:uncharacterized protein YecT (DUF1311 family)